MCQKYPVSTFHSKNPALQDSILVFNQDCEPVSQLSTYKNTKTLLLHYKRENAVSQQKNTLQRTFLVVRCKASEFNTLTVAVANIHILSLKVQVHILIKMPKPRLNWALTR